MFGAIVRDAETFFERLRRRASGTDEFVLRAERAGTGFDEVVLREAVNAPGGEPEPAGDDGAVRPKSGTGRTLHSMDAKRGIDAAVTVVTELRRSGAAHDPPRKRPERASTTSLSSPST